MIEIDLIVGGGLNRETEPIQTDNQKQIDVHGFGESQTGCVRVDG